MRLIPTSLGTNSLLQNSNTTLGKVSIICTILMRKKIPISQGSFWPLDFMTNLLEIKEISSFMSPNCNFRTTTLSNLRLTKTWPHFIKKTRVPFIDKFKCLKQCQSPKKMKLKWGNSWNWRMKVEEFWWSMKRDKRNFIWERNKTKGMWYWDQEG